MMDRPSALAHRVGVARYLTTQVFAVPAALVMVACYLRRSGWDLRIEDRFYDSAKQVFALRHAVWIELIGHELLLMLPIGIALVALMGAISCARFPHLHRWRPLLWSVFAVVCIGPLMIGVLKLFTAAHCPWDLIRYGGYADYAQDWFAASRAEAGRCMPNAHAGAGFSLLALYFAGWASGRRAWRWSGLGVGIAAGVVFSLVRMVQGAHFPSHSLWAAAIDWLVASLLFLPLICARAGSAGESTGKAKPPQAIPPIGCQADS
jgi:membrane-associated PAP2 superfamily phosphatase